MRGGPEGPTQDALGYDLAHPWIDVDAHASPMVTAAHHAAVMRLPGVAFPDTHFPMPGAAHRPDDAQPHEQWIMPLQHQRVLLDDDLGHDRHDHLAVVQQRQAVQRVVLEGVRPTHRLVQLHLGQHR